MVNEKVEGREMTWRTLFPWTELFRGFQVALDLNKLFLAAAGILVMAFGWWLLAVVFGSAYGTKPDWPSNYVSKAPNGNVEKAWEQFRYDRDQWNVMHETAKVGRDEERFEVLDLADSVDELTRVQPALEKAGPSRADKVAAIEQLAREFKKDDETGKPKAGLPPDRAEVYKTYLGTVKPAGKLSTWPWMEERGPNPFLLATGQTGIPWEPGHFWDWFLRHQLLVVLEPVVKIISPLVYFFSPRAEGLPRFYFFLVFLWTVMTWSFFGGAITRIAAVQVARGEKIGMMDAINFTVKRVVSYLTAPLFPVGFILVLVIFAILFGILQLIPLLGDFVSGLLWVIPIILGLLISVTLVGLVVGWPLMSPTISAEGTDSWEAVSRSFSYVFQKPFHYLWYCLVAACYGAILIFFIGFMGSFMVYMAKWSVSQTPFSGPDYTNREPTYLMVYAPVSFGWRDLLLQGAKVDGQSVVQNGRVNEEVLALYKKGGKDEKWHWWNTLGAGLVGIWLGVIFLLVVGFGYSFFWSAITIIYMLMRKAADGAELDEVYLEEDEGEGVFGSVPPAPAPPPAAPKQTSPLTMIEPPALRPAPAATPAVTMAPAATPVASTPVPTPTKELESSPPTTEPTNDGAEKTPPPE